MVFLFDIRNGVFHINDPIQIRKDLTPEDIKKYGMNFVREITQYNGLIIRVVNVFFIGKERWLALDFYKEKLKRLSFSFWDPELDKPYDYESNFVRQNAFLKKELGEPDESNNMYVLYRYPWGHISSTVDLKNMSSSIYMSWD